MAATSASHPSDQALRAYGQGRLDERSTESVEGHLASCRDCRRRVAELTTDRSSDRDHGGRARPDSPPPVGSSFPGLSRPEGGPIPAPPATETLPPGLAENPDYEVIRELGRGGMGVVYLARNTLMGRNEVLKVVSGNLLDRSIVRERFLREIRNAAQLHHPNIVTAYSAVRAGDQIVLAMEYVEGHDLAELVKASGPLSVAHAANFAYQAALGLQHAHEHGMVHRDIKPSNLILARSGKRATVKILDFGLAKATQEAPIDGGLTREGQMLGTPDYIAPEQSLDAQKADIRADIYSLGCTLYCLLNGGPPFAGASLYEILQAHHSRDALPLNLARPDVPAELAALVARMMAKAPEHRFQTPGQVAQALKPFFKPGQAAAVAVANPATSPKESPAADRLAAAPPPAAHTQAKPPRSGLALDMIDLGRDPGLSAERTAPGGGRRTGPRWLWISAGSLAILSGLLFVWKVGRDAGRQNAITAPPPAQTSQPDSGHRAAEDAPHDKAPPPRNASEAEGPGRLALRKPGPDAVAPERDQPKPAPAPTLTNVATPAQVEGKPRIVDQPLDIRQVRARTDVLRLAAPNLRRPSETFWPMLAPDNLKDWRVGNPDAIEMDESGVFLSAGSSGNLLLTRYEGFRDCTLRLDVSAAKGTEAFLALRAHRGPDGRWRAITSRLYDEGGRIRGRPGRGFPAPRTREGADVSGSRQAIPRHLPDRGHERGSSDRETEGDVLEQLRDSPRRQVRRCGRYLRQVGHPDHSLHGHQGVSRSRSSDASLGFFAFFAAGRAIPAPFSLRTDDSPQRHRDHRADRNPLRGKSRVGSAHHSRPAIGRQSPPDPAICIQVNSSL